MIQVAQKSQFQTLLIPQTQMKALNWQRLCIPIVLILHSFLNITYYKSLFFEWDSRQWACYFHCIQQGVMAMWVVVLTRKHKRTYLDNQFLRWAVIYNLFLICCYLYRQCTGDKNTSHLIGCGFSMIVLGLSIIRSCFKFKYFNKLA